MTPEGKVKEAVKKYLKSIGAYYYMPVSNGMGRVGAPDFFVCRPVTITPDMVGMTVGMFVGVETKAPGKLANTTPNQERELQAIRDAGGVAVVIDDVKQLENMLT